MPVPAVYHDELENSVGLGDTLNSSRLKQPSKKSEGIAVFTLSIYSKSVSITSSRAPNWILNDRLDGNTHIKTPLKNLYTQKKAFGNAMFSSRNQTCFYLLTKSSNHNGFIF